MLSGPYGSGVDQANYFLGKFKPQVGDIVAMLVGEPGRGDMRALARGDVTTTVGLVLGSPDFQRR